LNQEDYQDIIDDKECKADSVVYIKDCKGGNYTINSYSAKILIDGCHSGTKIVINGKVLSQMIEVWNCNNIDVEINTNVKTLQIDQNDKVNILYHQKEDFHQLIWAGCNSTNLKIKDFEDQICLDFDALKKQDDNLRKDIQQYIVRIIDSK
jgi:hypothetical protein